MDKTIRQILTRGGCVFSCVCRFVRAADAGRLLQYVVHDGLLFVQRVHVQVQDGHQAAVQRGKQRRRLERLLRAGQETAPERVVGLQ